MKPKNDTPWKLPEKARLLVVRPDRIGDVVLSTPVFASIAGAKPQWKISALVRPAVAELLEGHPHLYEVITLSTDDKPSFSNIAGLSARLREKKFDAVIHLYSDFWVSLAVFLAKIPLRIGPASKAAQIFYNVRITQRRSSGERHEADCNLDLLKPLGIPPVRVSSVCFSDNLPENLAGSIQRGSRNVGVFPGMGGSARNWKPARYAELADMLDENGVNVILMAGPGEENLLNEVSSACEKKHNRIVISSLKNLAGFIKRLDCFVAPSTGPLHIATAVGTPAVGIYCPIRVCLPSRWGPIGEKDAAYVPDVPVCEKCAPSDCREYDCMDKLSVKTVAKGVMERI